MVTIFFLLDLMILPHETTFHAILLRDVWRFPVFIFAIAVFFVVVVAAATATTAAWRFNNIFSHRQYKTALVKIVVLSPSVYL